MQDSKRDTDLKNRFLDSVGEGEGGMIRENSIETYIVICKSANSMHEAQNSNLLFWDNPEGWGGERGSGWGTHVHPRLIHVDVWQKPPQCYN